MHTHTHRLALAAPLLALAAAGLLVYPDTPFMAALGA